MDSKPSHPDPGVAEASDHASASSGSPNITAGSQHLHRKLGGKEVQLFAVGGAIGTSLFVQMGAMLPKAGPAGLLLGFLAYTPIILAVNQCFAEMVCYLPIPSPFIRLAGHWVDDALSFAMGWNFFFTMAFGIPYEIVAINILLTYWTDRVPVAAVVVIMLVLYTFLNMFTVRFFGVSEFYLSFFKIFLMVVLLLYTFITMVGGNPRHDVYGFRYWRDPGAFVSYIVPGGTGRFCSVIACMIQGSFTMVGPEYISMAAAEAAGPRRVMRKAYASYPWRLVTFFILGALSIGILIPYNDPTLAANLGSGTGAASPYIISMTHFTIPILPSITNALIMTSVISAGNNLVFSASRTLHGMSLEGRAPRLFTKCNRHGLPYNAVAISLSFCLLAFLQISTNSSTVLTWLVGIIVSSYLLNYIGTCITYLHFYEGLRRQGISRDTLPYKGYFQPYVGWFALVGTVVMTLVIGFEVFLDGQWDVQTFFLDYTMLAAFVVACAGWKVVKGTRYVRPGRADLGVGGLKREIDEYESEVEVEAVGVRMGVRGWWNGLFE